MSVHELREFDISALKRKPMQNIVVIGKKNTGKSVLIKDICSHISDSVPLFITMSGSESSNGFYSKMMPDCFVFNDIDDERFRLLLTRQKKLVELINRKKRGFQDIKKNVCLILDDCLTKTDWAKSAAMQDIVMNGRHNGFTLIIALQSFKKVPPYLRQNIDYAFLLRNNNFTERKNIREELFGEIKSKSEFDGLFADNTNNHGCIVVDNTSDSNEISKRYFKYRAKPDISPKLCDSIYWDFDKVYKSIVFEKTLKKEEDKKEN